jgi:phage terminase Nu1 subunit (DNA packaging protein)
MPTQQDIAADLGLSQPAISGALGKLGLLKREYEAMPMEEIRRLLVRHYTEIAGGRGGDDQFNLTQERARESRLKGDLLQLQIQEKSGVLIPADAVEQQWTALVVACKTELLLIPDKLAAMLKALHGIDVDPALIEQPINDALIRLANQTVDPDP